MQRRMGIFFATIVGYIFMIMPVDKLNGLLGKALTYNLEALLYLLGFIMVVFFGIAVLADALRNIKNRE